jgi:hypothetical protein
MEMVKIKTGDGVIIEMPKTALEHYPHLKHFLLQDNTEMPQTETQTPSSDTETEEKQGSADTSEQTLLRKNQRTSKKNKDTEETQQ